jgi:hypothetical protein
MFSMPTSFANFYERSMRTGPYVWALVGAVFISFGLYTYLSQIRIEASSVQVSLVVLDIIEDSGENRRYAPKFQIIEGTHKGKTYLGNVYVSPPIHEVGDKVYGWYQEETGLIRSVEMLASLKAFGKLFTMMGFVSALAGIGWAAVRRHRLSNSRPT